MLYYVKYYKCVRNIRIHLNKDHRNIKKTYK